MSGSIPTVEPVGMGPGPEGVARDAYRLRAYEVWGGSEAASDHITVPGFEAYVYSKPHEGASAGGDLRFVSTCAMGQIVRFTIADIAGHGEPAAGWAERLKAMMRKHINTPNPEKFARALNWEFTRMAREGGFATAVITTYFAPTDHLIVCNAGHPRPMLYRAKDGRWRFFDEGLPDKLSAERSKETGIANLPLGIVGPTSYPMHAARLERGDVFVAYTDALIEAKDAEGRQLGEEGLMRIVEAVGTVPRAGDPEAFGRAVLDRVAAFRGGRESDDDTTLLVLDHTATNPPEGPMARLRALGRLVGLVST